MRMSFQSLAIALACVSFLPVAALANPVNIGYQEPAQAIIDIVDAAPAPGANVSPGGDFLLVLDYPALPTLRDLAAPEYRLAGRRINPINGTVSQARYIENFRLIRTQSGEAQPIENLPADLRAIGVSWAPSADYFAFVQMDDDSATLWKVDVHEKRAYPWSSLPLNNVWGTQLEWSQDSQRILVTLIDPNRGAEPQRPRIPSAPVITESRGRSAPARTYQDLLNDEHDEALFDYHFSSQIAEIHLSGDVTLIGKPGVYSNVQWSPDNHHILVTELQGPYSYAVPQSRFARTTEVWNMDGESIYLVVDQPIADNLPIGFDSVVETRRSIGWRNDTDATLIWAEAADGGNPRASAAIRDRVYQLAAPFDSEPTHLMDLSFRFARFLAADGEIALIWERWWADRNERVWNISPDGDRTPELVWERSWEDSYNDPGTPLLTRVDGKRVLLLDEGHIILTGTGASDEGDRPFIRRRHLNTGETTELWRSESPYFERPMALLNWSARRFLTQRESIDTAPDFYVRELSTNALVALTETPHPMPDTLGISRELIHYEREDGLPMSATLFLPADYDAERDGPLPTIIWAYPREFRSSAAAAQVSGSPYEFNRISFWRPQFLATQGYAVLDNATMPIVGEGAQLPNDTFIEQLIMNSSAAIGAGVARGVTDPKRVALGGHSYGAFMTANVLAHSDLFQAGIARSGAYNRSLTPFGFQREERTIWDDPALYQRMSPFFSAHQIKTPLLLIHGAEDNNSGTFPMQSERLYQAIKGNGGVTRLVMLPLESHGYRARESVLHMLWETVEWLDEFVKHAE